jgi:hypothetical protein
VEITALNTQFTSGKADYRQFLNHSGKKHRTVIQTLPTKSVACVSCYPNGFLGSAGGR